MTRTHLVVFALSLTLIGAVAATQPAGPLASAALATVAGGQAVAESPRSDLVTAPVVVLKWDQPAASLAEVQSFRWVIYVSGTVTERVEVPEVQCLPPTGQTPKALFSCVLPLRPAWGGQSLQVAAWVPAPVLAAPRLLRLVGQPAPE